MSLIWDLTNIIFNLSKCQKRFEERNLLMRIPEPVRDLFDFWKEQQHKKVQISQYMLDTLAKSVQDLTSRTAMASGGILSELRSGLLQCLPVLDKYQEFLKTKAERKVEQTKSKEVTNAVECVVTDIGEREKITLIGIGGKDTTCPVVKKIMESLVNNYEPANISIKLPEDRRRRFEVLNQKLVEQSPTRLCVWTFDNHGTAPQSVFAFLVPLEDDSNTILKNIMRLRQELLAQQKIFFPREFRQQFKYFSSSIVDISSAPMRMLLSMVLGDSRGSHEAASKLVEERALDAILSDDEELAVDLRQFNGRESQFLSFLAVVRRTLSEFLAEDKNRWQNSYDGTIVSNMSMALSLRALFDQCVENALKNDPRMPIPSSEKFLCRYLYPRTAAAAAAVSSSEPLLALRWAVQQKVLEKPNPDSYYNMSQYKSLKTFAVHLGNGLVTMISTDDKAGIDVGEPGEPIVACQHPGKSWIPSQLKLGEGQHSFHKFNLTPSVRLVHDLPSDIGGSFHRGRPQITVKDAVFEPSKGARHFTELKKSFEVDLQAKKPVVIITNDGGPDHNIHHDRNKASLLAFFLNNPQILYIANFQMAANRSSLHPVEKVNCIINLALNGVALARDDQGDPNFEKLLKSCKSMADIRKNAEHNPGLIDHVAASLKGCREIIEHRSKQVALKENPIEVFEPATSDEILEFLNVLKSIDANFDAADYLDTKKKFNLSGPLLEYYNDVSTTTYYCVTMVRHKNMSKEFLNSLYQDLVIPFDLHAVPCPIKDPDNSEKYLKFEDLYFSRNLRSYDDKQRPGKVEKPSPNIPFPKSIVRAKYCSSISLVCEACSKRRVLYSKYKPTFAQVDQARAFLENMKYQCGARLCHFGTEGIGAVVETNIPVPAAVVSDENSSSDSDIAPVRKEASQVEESSGDDIEDIPADIVPNQVCQEIQLLGDQSIFSKFFVDESLQCSHPIEKHLYEVIQPSVTQSPPCYYCGETDLVRTSVQNENEYPLCLHCRTVKKFGPVLKRKKRTIEPRKQKPKNKKRKPTVGFVDEDESDEVEEEINEVPEDNEMVIDEIESAYEKIYETMGEDEDQDSDTEDVESQKKRNDEDDNISNSSSPPQSPVIDVEELIADSEED